MKVITEEYWHSKFHKYVVLDDIREAIREWDIEEMVLDKNGKIKKVILVKKELKHDKIKKQRN